MDGYGGVRVYIVCLQACVCHVHVYEYVYACLCGMYMHRVPVSICVHFCEYVCFLRYIQEHLYKCAHMCEGDMCICVYSYTCVHLHMHYALVYMYVGSGICVYTNAHMYWGICVYICAFAVM